MIRDITLVKKTPKKTIKFQNQICDWIKLQDWTLLDFQLKMNTRKKKNTTLNMKNWLLYCHGDILYNQQRIEALAVKILIYYLCLNMLTHTVQSVPKQVIDTLLAQISDSSENNLEKNDVYMYGSIFTKYHFWACVATLWKANVESLSDASYSSYI